MKLIISVFIIIAQVMGLVLPGFRDLTTTPMDETTVKNQMKDIKLYALTEEPYREVISCYAVRDDCVAVCLGSSKDEKTIAVYTKDGEYRYGYFIQCPGRVGLEWEEDHLCIWVYKKQIILTLAQDASILSTRWVTKTWENRKYWSTVMTPQKSSGTDSYSCEDEIEYMFMPYWQKLYRTDENGKKTVVYEAEFVLPADQNRETISWLLLIFVVYLGIAGFVFFKFIPKKQKNGDSIPKN